MTVTVNGEPRVVAARTTVDDLVRQLGRDPGRRGTAIARNGDVVPRREWPSTQLADGDQIEVVTAAAGG